MKENDPDLILSNPPEIPKDARIILESLLAHIIKRQANLQHPDVPRWIEATESLLNNNPDLDKANHWTILALIKNGEGFLLDNMHGD
jgi:hypothetical protein